MASEPAPPVEPGLTPPEAGFREGGTSYGADWVFDPECVEMDHRCRNRDGMPLQPGQECWIKTRRATLLEQLEQFTDRHPQFGPA
ncbi:MAG TPA: hypothetical protein VHT75_19465 [Acidimicrobiales bacterium]|nr:hypothetical protein [Acidimicrobiales bacterium]